MGWGDPKRPVTSNKTSAPSPREGSDGDIQVRQTHYGPKLFGKLGGRWLSTYLFIDSDAFNIKNRNGALAAKITSKGSIELQGNRVVTAGGITSSSDNNLAVGHINNLSTLVATGSSALATYNQDNIAIGRDVLSSSVNIYSNVAIGNEAMQTMGISALDGSTETQSNVAIGNGAMKGKTDGTRTTGASNVAIGHGAMRYCDNVDDGSGTDYNVCLGQSAGLHTSGTGNIYIGRGSGAGTQTATCGANVALGYLSMISLTSGANNTCCGPGTGMAIDTGDNNICLGRNAGTSGLSSADNNILIGNQALCSNADTQIAIGRSTSVSAQYGIAIGDNISAAANDCVIGRNGETITVDFDADGTWAYSSDIRKKRNIQDDTLGLSFINNLKTKTFQWKPAEEHPEEWCNWEDKYETVINSDDLSNITHEDIPTGERVYSEMNTEIVMHGMIAQDVKEALDVEGVDTFGGWRVSECGEQSLGKSMFVFPLIKAVQELSAKVDTMQTQINNLTQ